MIFQLCVCILMRSKQGTGGLSNVVSGAKSISSTVLLVYLMEKFLGSTFAEFYMCDLEKEVVEMDTVIKLIFFYVSAIIYFFWPWVETEGVPAPTTLAHVTLYTRYVDNISVVFDDITSLQNLESKLSEESVLCFTHEFEKAGFCFLDCIARNIEEGDRSSVHVKYTKTEECLNYKSIFPKMYEVGLIKVLLHRGHLVSSNCQVFYNDTGRKKTFGNRC